MRSHCGLISVSECGCNTDVFIDEISLHIKTRIKEAKE